MGGGVEKRVHCQTTRMRQATTPNNNNNNNNNNNTTNDNTNNTKQQQQQQNKSAHVGDNGVKIGHDFHVALEIGGENRLDAQAAELLVLVPRQRGDDVAVRPSQDLKRGARVVHLQHALHRGGGGKAAGVSARDRGRVATVVACADDQQFHGQEAAAGGVQRTHGNKMSPVSSSLSRHDLEPSNLVVVEEREARLGVDLEDVVGARVADVVAEARQDQDQHVEARQPLQRPARDQQPVRHLRHVKRVPARGGGWCVCVGGGEARMRG